MTPDPAFVRRVPRWLLGISAVAVAVCDVLQVLVVGKGLGAIGGAAIYTAIAVGTARGHRWPLGLAAIMPGIPASVMLGLAGEATRRSQVDPGMVAVFMIQLAAALSAVLALARERGAPDSR